MILYKKNKSINVFNNKLSLTDTANIHQTDKSDPDSKLLFWGYTKTYEKYMGVYRKTSFFNDDQNQKINSSYDLIEMISDPLQLTYLAVFRRK